MNKNLYNFCVFTVGAAIGSAVTYAILKERYKRIADEEIDSMREYYKRKLDEIKESISDIDDEEDEAESSDENVDEDTEKKYADYAAIIRRSQYNKEDAEEVECMNEPETWPYVITPEEFGEYGYQEVSLNHYADGVLTDELDQPIEDIEGTVGKDYATHFGEYEADSVFIRNDELQIDFEILADLRKFSDLPKTKLCLTEDE